MKVFIIIAAIVIIILLICLFVWLYALNKKTPVPDDCPKDELADGCGSCMLSCHIREKNFDVKNLIKENNDVDSNNESTDNKEK